MSDCIWTKELCRSYADGLRPMIRHDHRRIAQKISEKIENKPGLKVVDIATGPGFLLLELAMLLDNSVLVAHDSSFAMLEIAVEEAKKYDKQISVCESPAESITLENDSADLVLCKQLLHEAADYSKVIAEICRILKPGGKAFIIDFDADGNKIAALLIKTFIRFSASKKLADSFWKSFSSGLKGSSVVECIEQNKMKNVEYLKYGASYFISFEKP